MYFMAITFYGNAINISLSVSLCSIFILILIDCLQFINNLHFFGSFVICLLTSRRCGGGSKGVGGSQVSVTHFWVNDLYLLPLESDFVCVCLSVCVWLSLPFSNVNPEKLFTRFCSFSFSSFSLDLARYAFGHVETATELNFPRQRPFMRFSSQFR